MIVSFAHKGLEKFFLTGSKKGIQAPHAKRLKLILGLLNEAQVISDLDAPGLRLHEMKGDLTHHWSVSVSANWRIVFRFENGDIHLVNYMDYH